MVARQRIWTIWGLASLVWLVVGTALFGAGLGVLGLLGLALTMVM